MFKKIYIEITNVCNLKCKFCPETKRKKAFMSVEDFEKIIIKIYKYTNLVCLHVKGEPLLHPQLEDILKVLEKYNLKTNITTNGLLIKEKLDILKSSSSVRQINFSLHSFTENEMFNGKYLENIFESVEELENVIISYRLWNLEDIYENDKNKPIINTLENYYSIEKLKEKLSKNNFIKLKENIFINQDVEFSWPDISKEDVIKNGRCLALKDQIAILVDGTAVPCCLDNNGDIPLGNALEEEFTNILNSPKALGIRKNFEQNIISCKLCRTCGFLVRLEAKRKKGFS